MSKNLLRTNVRIRYYGTLLVVLASTAAVGSGQRADAPSQATLKAVTAAKTFLAALDSRQRAKVSLELNARARANWSNLPTGTVFPNGATERNGLKLGDMTTA